MDPLQPGDPAQVGGYRLLGRLGAGGMGQVFYGRSRGGRPVAIKLIRPDHADTKRFRERFAREVEAARRVGGFHTAQVVDADPHADPPWMVTAYIPGPSLHQVVADHGPLPVEAVGELGAGLAEGLAAIHACDLVHRDLKPSNVILGDDGPRIIDFGIARALDTSTMTESGAVLGTYSYMSPEQVRGQSVGPASDVFALGSLLAYAATGRAPFGGGSIATIVHRITSESPDLHEVPTGHDLRDLIAGCLAKDPAVRPALAEILQRLADHEPIGAGPPAAAATVTTRRPDPRIVMLDTSQGDHDPSDRSLEDGQRAGGEESVPGTDLPPPVPAPRRRSARRRRPLILTVAATIVATLTAVTLIITKPWSAKSDPPASAAATRMPDHAAERELPVVLSTFFHAYGAQDSATLARFTNGASLTSPRERLTFVQLNSVRVFRIGKITEAEATVTWQRPTTPSEEPQRSYQLTVEKIDNTWYVTDLAPLTTSSNMPLVVTIGRVECPRRTVVIIVRNVARQARDYTIELDDDSPPVADRVGPGAIRSTTVTLREDRRTSVTAVLEGNRPVRTVVRTANCRS